MEQPQQLMSCGGIGGLLVGKREGQTRARWDRWGNNNGKLFDLALGTKLLHYIALLFGIHFPDSVIIFHRAELVSNYFLGYVISCVVTKHTMWTSDCIT